MKKALRLFGFVFLGAGLIFSIGCSSGSSKSNSAVSTSSKTIATFGFSNPSATGIIDESAKTVSVIVPYATDVTTLVAVFTTTGAKTLVGTIEQTSGTTQNNFTSPVTYTVTAADGTTQDYAVTVTVSTSTAKEFAAFLLSGYAGTISSTVITVTVPYGTDVTTLIATFSHTGSSVKVGTADQVSGTTANNFASPVIYTVTAANGSTHVYQVTVTVSDVAVSIVPAFAYMYCSCSSEFSAVVTPETAAAPAITWKSSDTSIATVDSKGVVTSVGSGVVTITAAPDGKNFTVSSTCVILPTAASSVFTVSSAGAITAYTGKEAFVMVPTVIDGKTITALGDDPNATGAFYGNTYVKSIYLPSSITTIVTKINAYVPTNACTSLTGVYVASGNSTYKDIDGIVYKKDGTAIVLVPQGITGSPRIPSTLTALPYTNAFYCCANLTSVIIPSSVSVIKNSCFFYCTGLKSVTIPSSITSIENAAFYNCTSLSSVTIPSRVTLIGTNCFSGCTNLAIVRIEATTPPDITSTTTAGAGVTTMGISSSVVIQVPTALVSTYKTSASFSQYASQIVGY